MPWLIQRHLSEGRAQPVLLCDDCLKPITPHDPGCVAWENPQAVPRRPREIRFFHQRCLDLPELLSPLNATLARAGRDDDLEDFCRRMFDSIAAPAYDESQGGGS